jgi:hypothetical protein
MSSTSARLDRQTIEVLLSALEAPQALLSAAALQSFPARVGIELLAGGFIKPDGHEAAATSLADHNDVPIMLTWSSDHGAYGYFSQAAGWINVPAIDIVRYRIDFALVLSALTAKLNISKRREPVELVVNRLWLLGNVRLGRRTHLTEIMFGRRLHDAGSWQAIRRVLEDRPCEQRRIILTSTRPDRLPEAPTDNLLLAIRDLAGNNGLTLDPEIISARLERRRAEDYNDDLVLIADAKEVRFRGETFRFPKGVHQRRIIRYIDGRYRRGHLWTSNDEIIDKLDLRESARIRDYFKGSPAWNRLLTERDGMCGFCFEPVREAK